MAICCPSIADISEDKLTILIIKISRYRVYKYGMSHPLTHYTAPLTIQHHKHITASSITDGDVPQQLN